MKEEGMIDLLFETSWEICNKVGGIHTVISTKALNLVTVSYTHLRAHET